MLTGDWRSKTDGLDELSRFIRETVRGCNSTAIVSISQTEFVYTTIAVDHKCKVMNDENSSMSTKKDDDGSPAPKKRLWQTCLSFATTSAQCK